MPALMQSPPGPLTRIDDREYLYFGGTSYLGLAGRPSVIEAGVRALRKYGVHTATSRTGYGNNPSTLAVEEEAARFFGKSSSFYFGSGYMSNHILISLALDILPEATVFTERSSHFCVLEASRLGKKDPVLFDWDRLESLEIQINEKGKGPVIVMADAVSPVTGRLAPVEDYLAILSRGDSAAILILDDAHGIGVLGDAGRGRLELAGLWDRVNESIDPVSVPIFMGATLSKALGGFGGIIPGSTEFVERAKAASDYFGGASAPASAEAACTAEALKIVQQEPDLRLQLLENSLHLRSGLAKLGLDPLPHPTAHLGMPIGSKESMLSLHEKLKERGIILPYISRYVGIPKSGAMRFAVFSNHTRSQIDLLLQELNTWMSFATTDGHG
jgi:8-amino-7-oxononanoate synthase